MAPVPGAPVSVGQSMLVDPMGVVGDGLELVAGVRAVELSLKTGERGRELFPMFRQRRLLSGGWVPECHEGEGQLHPITRL